MVAKAAEKGDLAMVKLLHAQGATLNASSRGQKTPLERALDSGHLQVAKYLVQNQAKIDDQTIRNYVVKNNADLDTIYLLVENGPTINPTGYRWSNLRLIATRFNESPNQCKKIIQLLIQKGDRPGEDDQNLPISVDAEKYIDTELAKVRA